MSKKDSQLEPLSEMSLGDLSIEELEERLELQIMHPPETQNCYDCENHTDCKSYTEGSDEPENPNPA